MRFIATLLLGCLFFVCASAKNHFDDPSSVRQLIIDVNDKWQSFHQPDVWAFWDEAAYHTGNMEAYFLLGKPEWLTYSTDWANHNQWKGAKSNDKKSWRLDYGENDDHVLFGDWQICFQTYLDLNSILPEDNRVKRAIEVMDYQMSTDRSDYWWWADGLYMVMPVMTKLYKLTNDQRYLDKLYEYIQYSDSIMYDNEDGLYYRDSKYVYPQHATAAGVKDFWARGDGWVFAGLCKVLNDLPQDFRYRQFFEDKYRRMAQRIIQCQQPEGYWSRSMLDEEQAPGYETSGTAFFTYGLLWGLNNGLIEGDNYIDSAIKGWKYLTEVALQKDKTIGYVQPIGEKAIPGQTVDAKSTSNFGTGAWLLAACEYVRYLERNSNDDRDYWVYIAEKIASPILENMSKGELQKNMIVEVSPTWDGRNIKVVYMEAFGRLMAGIAPWLSLPDDDSPESKIRERLRSQALAAYAKAVDPESDDYLLWRGEGQALVDAAYIAESFLRGYDALWQPLDSLTKARYIERFKQLREVDPPYTNWLLFSSTIESLLAKIDAEADMYRVNSALRKIDEWYVGDGWYSDGQDFAFDYYNSYVIHPMYLETLQAMIDSKHWNKDHYKRTHRKALKRTQKYVTVLERMISPDGTFPVFGRSIPYRMAALQPLALLSLYDRLPAGITPGQARNVLTKSMHRMYDNNNIFNEGQYLTIGFGGAQKNIADWYTNNGSLYMTSLSLLPLGLPANHRFWTDAPQPGTTWKAWGGEPFPKDHIWKD